MPPGLVFVPCAMKLVSKWVATSRMSCWAPHGALANDPHRGSTAPVTPSQSPRRPSCNGPTTYGGGSNSLTLGSHNQSRSGRADLGTSPRPLITRNRTRTNRKRFALTGLLSETGERFLSRSSHDSEIPNRSHTRQTDLLLFSPAPRFFCAPRARRINHKKIAARNVPKSAAKRCPPPRSLARAKPHGLAGPQERRKPLAV
jgi:hypothetical protein